MRLTCVIFKEFCQFFLWMFSQFSCSKILYWSYHRNGWANWHETKNNTFNGCWANCVTSTFHLTHDLDLGFSRTNFEIAISQEWRAHWHGMNGMDSTMWPWAMTLTLDFQYGIFKMLNPKKRMPDWHGTEGTWVDRMLDSLCELLAMTLTLDFQGQNLIKPYPRNGMADWQGTKGILVDWKSHPLCEFELRLTFHAHDFDLRFSRSNFQTAILQYIYFLIGKVFVHHYCE